MAGQKLQKAVTLDGRTGEGGGQVIRLAVCLAALTRTPLSIHHVRGNRPGKRGGDVRGGGLKAQHVAGIQCLADLTQADVTGCFVGSHSFDFQANLTPGELKNRNIRIKADSAASVLLVFQTILPFLIFAGDEHDSPIAITIQGGTNVSFSLSFEYLDQVLLPALERFGISVERNIEYRGWSHGTRQIGSAKFKFVPLPPTASLRNPNWPSEQGKLTHIDISLVVPAYLQQDLKKAMLFELDLVFPGVGTAFKVIDDSKHNARIYTLLVGHTSTGLKFGRDWLYDERSKDKSADELSTRIAQKVVDDLDTEIRKGGVVDEYLQDQLIVFQALSEGKSNIFSSAEGSSPIKRVDRTDEPFGEGSTHTTTARWVSSQLLPQIQWAERGQACFGVGWKASR